MRPPNSIVNGWAYSTDALRLFLAAEGVVGDCDPTEIVKAP
jgi:hypothetical protein